ncbi:hypothetical protein SEA_PRAIRIE_67 [Arthrobacter phage Prairie]|uniref:Uncharacterized protein n=1 Tax=Arthrobacter phage Prairie TaxID=2816463 RepID=A0A8A5LUG8_9CAUD|nr:hypothetical protein SEA_PRAIRIE_67 [Arthrobacter phage Prairie]
MSEEATRTTRVVEIATVERDPVRARSWVAWCKSCEDGIRATRSKAEGWADRHNADRHGLPTPHVDREQWIPGK